VLRDGEGISRGNGTLPDSYGIWKNNWHVHVCGIVHIMHWLSQITWTSLDPRNALRLCIGNGTLIRGYIVITLFAWSGVSRGASEQTHICLEYDRKLTRYNKRNRWIITQVEAHQVWQSRTGSRTGIWTTEPSEVLKRPAAFPSSIVRLRSSRRIPLDRHATRVFRQAATASLSSASRY
jgi:hypothetical protein